MLNPRSISTAAAMSASPAASIAKTSASLCQKPLFIFSLDTQRFATAWA